MGDLLCFQKNAVEVLNYRIAELERRIEANEKKITNTSRALFARDSRHDKDYDSLRYEFEQVKLAVCTNSQAGGQKIVEFKLEAS